MDIINLITQLASTAFDNGNKVFLNNEEVDSFYFTDAHKSELGDTVTVTLSVALKSNPIRSDEYTFAINPQKAIRSVRPGHTSVTFDTVLMNKQFTTNLNFMFKR